jgi:hypothetical protein
MGGGTSARVVSRGAGLDAFLGAVADFADYGRPSERTSTVGADGTRVPTFVNEFWTARQRAACSLHEISYRACFKPALPRFFIQRLTAPGDVVHDPFCGRGTTPVEAALGGRVPIASDVNPLSRVLVEPRLRPPPSLDAIADRLAEYDLEIGVVAPPELEVFYHPDTLREIAALRAELIEREAGGSFDQVDAFVRMVAVNRLTGHSPGFFSVYTMPPNQAVSVQSQRRINARRAQRPPRRDVRALILRKARALLRGVSDADRAQLGAIADRALVLTRPCAGTPELPGAIVDLVVTSPPFLDVVAYAADNWLRCWFCGIDAERLGITAARRLEDWTAAMRAGLVELARVVRPGGAIAFEVGEVRGGTVRLEEHAVAAGSAAGLDPVCVLIHDQQFTKTANCWGVGNNRLGTNSNRIVVFERP